MDEIVKNYLSHHGILGQKWGVRRYQNKDGTLTDKGKKRYNRDIQENLRKKKENRIDTSNPDPSRWVREDLTRRKNVADTSLKFVKELNNIEKDTRPKTTMSKMDLSKMSDKEMRERINREFLERQYNNLFSEVNSHKVSKGRKFVQGVLNSAGTVLGVTGSALGIALSIKELRG